jgi:hypothetical protein
MNYIRDKKLLLTVYFIFYYAVFLFFYLDDRLLSQYQPFFFNYNRDLTELALIGSGLPRWLIAHPLALTAADLLAFLLPAALLFFAIRKGRFSLPLGAVFIAFLALYLLLADIFWQVHLEPFTLYFLLSFAFICNRRDRFYLLLKVCRYYFLYVFVSAAIWKIARGAIFNVHEMSRILLLHHSDLLSGYGGLSGGQLHSFSSWVYGWLIAHPAISYLFYLGGALLEATFVIGFFTRRIDRMLIVLTLVFVIADLLVMRIPYWTILLGTVTLWIGSGATAGNEKKIIIYETTHHENLPALLDLSEAHFSRVTVFLRELSFRNLSGDGAPGQRWPRTDFIVQPAGRSNRSFIRQVFSLLKKERYTHLHLSTLDNNLLVFALRLAWAGPVHCSLTIHEVNAYFACTFRTLRDSSESIARILLRRQIRHYTFFLPAMAQYFSEKLPGVTTVFIPSRFYRRPPPRAAADEVTPASLFRIIVPGSVDPNRRSYDELPDVFKALLARKDPAHGQDPRRPIQLVILGDSATAYGAAKVSALQQLESPQFRLLFFKGYIPEPVYEQEIKGADLIWSPLNLQKKGSRNSPETYGQTTASGLTADLLLNNAPALVPAGFVIPESFSTAILTYVSAKDAVETIDRLWRDNGQSRELREKIDYSFGFFSIANFSAAFRELTGAGTS